MDNGPANDKEIFMAAMADELPMVCPFAISQTISTQIIQQL